MTYRNDIFMFYSAKPEIFEKAKILRENATDAEKILWEFLRKKNVFGLRFRQQHPIDIFIADFYCHKLKLVIEVDGTVHDRKEQNEYDEGRTGELNRLGIEVIRFTNRQIMHEFGVVKKTILSFCEGRYKELYD